MTPKPKSVQASASGRVKVGFLAAQYDLIETVARSIAMEELTPDARPKMNFWRHYTDGDRIKHRCMASAAVRAIDEFRVKQYLLEDDYVKLQADNARLRALVENLCANIDAADLPIDYREIRWASDAVKAVLQSRSVKQ